MIKILSFLFTFFLFVNISCNNHNPKQDSISDTIPEFDSLFISENIMDSALVDSADASKIGIRFYPNGDYNLLKNQFKERRRIFYNKYMAANDSLKIKIIKEAGDYLFDNMINGIIPFWYKTPWDLSGYSNIPKEGAVGCSYFVSNTLVACGFNLNRYRLAQTDPIAGSQSLTFTDSVVKYFNEGFIDDIAKKILMNHSDGLYIIGLDMHIGYLLIYKSRLYFIHSAYYYPNVVCIEYFEKSPGIYSSMNYYITPITTNKKLIEKWIINESIFIQKPIYMKVDEARWNKQ